MYATAITLHVFAALLWVGGLFFSYVVLRPAAQSMEPPERLNLWAAVFKRFFPWVWLGILVLLLSGYYMIFGVFGGFKGTPPYVHIMHLLGLIMMGLFVYLHLRLYAPFKKAVAAKSYSDAAGLLNRIRHVVLVNLVMGSLLVAIVFILPRL